MEEKIIEIMRRVFGTNDVNTDTAQINTPKWDSLRHLNLVVELEDEFGVEFEPEEIADMKSFNAIKSLLDRK